jgi:hypothetical protein
MSAKMGQRSTGRKPTSVRRTSSKTTGASGKETANQVTSGDANQNIDKATRRTRVGHSGGGR